MTYGNYPDLENVRKILVVKMRHHGDVLLSSPVFSNLKKAMPKACIDALIYKETLPMLEGHPAIANFILYDRAWKKLPLFRKLAKEWSILRAIRKAGYDLVLNLTEGDRGALAAFISGAKICVGCDPEGKGFLGKRKAYTHIVKACKMPRHAVERGLDALRCIGIFPKPEERGLTLFIGEEERKKISLLVPEEYIVVHPVSRWRFKCWPVAKVASLIDALQAKGQNIVLTASPDKDEMAMIGAILEKCSSERVTNLAGKISLKELSAVMSGAKGLITVDSVPLHIASALKTPVVVLFGPTSEKNWGPWMHPFSRVVAQNFSCRPCFQDGCGGSKMSDCLHTLAVDRVLDAAEELFFADLYSLKSSPK